jgi:sulfur carrier protein ThiS
MEIHVTLVGSLRDHLPRQARGRATVTLADAATAGDLLAHFGLPATVSVAVAGVKVDGGQILHEGDQVQIFRQLGGG